MWRNVLKAILLIRADQTNGLRLTRGLQNFLPFLTGYEAYLLDQVIGEFSGGDPKALKFVLSVAFENKNVSRIIVQVSCMVFYLSDV